MSSIRARLVFALLVLLATLSLAFAALTYQRVLSETSTLFDYQLRQMALSLRGQISVAPRLEIPPDQAGLDYVVQIWDVFGARIYLSRPGLPFVAQTVSGYADLRLRGEDWRAFGLQTDQGVIQIAQPLKVRQELARTAALRVIVPLLLLLPCMGLCVAWIVRKGLAPLQTIAAEVERRDVDALRAVETRGLPDEIQPVVSELNRLLLRLHDAFDAQRAFVADAAHELRSPLTALRLHLQLLDRAPDESARRDAREVLGAAVERAIHLVEQLLTLARLEPSGPPAPLADCDLSAAVAAAAAECHALAEARDIALSVEGTSVTVHGDGPALRILARNLLDNAVRYTPAQGRVMVRTSVVANQALLEVHDSGPGIAPADRARLFDRFYRLAGSESSGSGLGLAIVKKIAERHAADVQVETSTLGGLQMNVRFPRA